MNYWIEGRKNNVTNLEFYKDEFVYMLSDVAYQPPLCNYFEKIWTYSDCSCCPFCTKDNTVCDYQRFVDWLLEEHKEPIKLKQWEKDLLKSFGDTASHHKFDYFPSLREMKHMGYFDGVKDTYMTLEDILNNCEVVE